MTWLCSSHMTLREVVRQGGGCHKQTYGNNGQLWVGAQHGSWEDRMYSQFARSSTAEAQRQLARDGKQIILPTKYAKLRIVQSYCHLGIILTKTGCLQSLCFVSRVAGRHGKVRCKIEGRSFLAAQVPVERSQEGIEFGCDLEECNVYRWGFPSFSSVQHVALCSFILSVVHLVAQLWDSSYMWQRGDFSFPVTFQCYPMWFLQRIVLSREKVWRSTLLAFSRGTFGISFVRSLLQCNG